MPCDVTVKPPLSMARGANTRSCCSEYLTVAPRRTSGRLKRLQSLHCAHGCHAAPQCGAPQRGESKLSATTAHASIDHRSHNASTVRI